MLLRSLLLAAIAAYAAIAPVLAEVPQIIADNLASTELRKRMIQGAGPDDEVSFITFNFYLEEQVQEVVRLLGDLAAKRRRAGNRVPVTVVIDGHFVDPTPGSGGHQAYLALRWLASQGARAYVYNPLKPLSPSASSLAKLWINHRKILAVGSSVLIGSRNAGSYHLAEFHRAPGSSFIEAEIFLPKGAAPAIGESVSSLARSMSGDPAAHRIGPGASEGLQLVKEPKFAPERIWGSALEGTYDWRLLKTDWAEGMDVVELARAIGDCVSGGLIFTPGRGFQGCMKLYRVLTRDRDRDEFRRAVRQAIHDEPPGGEILIESPYFYPDTETAREISRAIARGVRFHLITNSVYTSGGASKLILIYMDPLYRSWIREGGDRVRIEVSTDHHMHGKTFSFRAQKLFFAGSHNFHPRSGLFDTEAGVSFRADREDFMNLRDRYYRDFESTRCRKAGHASPILTPYVPIDLKALQHVLDAIPETAEWVGAPASVSTAVRALARKLRGSSSLTEFPENPGEWRITRAHRYTLWRAEVEARAAAIRAALFALEPVVGPFL